MDDPVFTEGQMVTPVYTNDYNLTMGKEYQVVMYEPQLVDGTFTWPAFVHFIDDLGKKCGAHARRFKEIPA